MKASPAFAQVIAKTFGAVLSTEQWRARFYGAFQSPVEASASLTMLYTVLCVYATNFLKLALFPVWVFIVWNTQSFSPAIAWGAAALLVLICVRSRSKNFSSLVPRAVLIVFASALLITFAVAIVDKTAGMKILSSSRPFLEKLSSVSWRGRLWLQLLKPLTESPNTLFLGMGFHPHNSDGMWVFILSRSGLLGFGLVLWALSKKLANFLKNSTPSQVVLLLQFVFMGLWLDAWIYRHLFAIFAILQLQLLRKEKR